MYLGKIESIIENNNVNRVLIGDFNVDANKGFFAGLERMCSGL